MDAYPLHWPTGWPRTPAGKRVGGKFKGTQDAVMREMLDEINRMARGTRVIISTNQPLRQDGRPSGQQRIIADPGVAVYFRRGTQDVSFACDKYDSIRKNMRAIHLTIAALRGIERWGSGQMVDRAFSGFTALPESTGNGWPTVLGVDSKTATVESVKAARVTLLRLYHEAGTEPDADKYRAVMDAYQDAMQQLGGNLRPTDHQ